jgi:hypothetical protein
MERESRDEPVWYVGAREHGRKVDDGIPQYHSVVERRIACTQMSCDITSMRSSAIVVSAVMDGKDLGLTPSRVGHRPCFLPSLATRGVSYRRWWLLRRGLQAWQGESRRRLVQILASRGS